MTARAETHAHHLRVVFADGRWADFHWFWLRHECSNERHPTTLERTLSSARIPLEISPTDVAVRGDAVEVRWAGEPAEREPSRYPLDWLREHAYAPDRAPLALPPCDTARLETVIDRSGRLAWDWAERLDRDGALVARTAGDTDHPEITERLIEQLDQDELRVIETHFGRIEDLRTDNTTNQNTDQLGYTDAAIDLHTDQPFLEQPPRYQLLHCIRMADEGGESLLSDARAAARWLAANDAPASDILRSTPVHFHRVQRAFQSLHVGPILRGDEQFQVRLSPFTMAPHRIPFAHMRAFYRAYGDFVRLAQDRAYRFTLRPGDVLLYDNHRMLHGRTGFRGPRWIRGVYFDRRS
jgi:gamma-butyrobetaine dioxygenase